MLISNTTSQSNHSLHTQRENKHTVPSVMPLKVKHEQCCQLGVNITPRKLCNLETQINLRKSKIEGLDRKHKLRTESEAKLKSYNTTMDKAVLEELKQCKGGERQAVFKSCCNKPDSWKLST